MRRCLTVLLSGLAVAASATASLADLRVSVDKDRQRMSVAVDGEIRHVWPVSTGLSRYDTPNGTYKAFRMEKTHFSREWDNAPMPHAIFFTPAGHAIHATNQTRHLGRLASHGCVRLSPRNAATLFALVRQQGLGRTRIDVEGSTAATVSGLHRSQPVRAARSGDRNARFAAQTARDKAWEQENYYGAPVRQMSRNPFEAGYGYAPVVVYDGDY
ncbi:L,D-transpeptidase [Methylobacterium marchantiae]|uniref:L,D-transpeptidase n=1 Tax=Methylobacterium marchantiae TaxID=600331 RepID=A0ABW3X3X4_9HYPH|nr:hypothetical protein AIGOOFII_1358 [Methylobacterium marchantiae]